MERTLGCVSAKISKYSASFASSPWKQEKRVHRTEVIVRKVLCIKMPLSIKFSWDSPMRQFWNPEILPFYYSGIFLFPPDRPSPFTVAPSYQPWPAVCVFYSTINSHKMPCQFAGRLHLRTGTSGKKMSRFGCVISTCV